MKALIHALFHSIASTLRERWHLSLELVALRHQVEVLKRSGTRPRFSSADRCVWLLLSRWWPKWPHVLEIMQADTVRRWRRQGVRHHVQWRRAHQGKGNVILFPTDRPNKRTDGPIRCRQRRGGLLTDYNREAAEAL